MIHFILLKFIPMYRVVFIFPFLVIINFNLYWINFDTSH